MKEGAPIELVAAIRSVVAGGRYLPTRGETCGDHLAGNVEGTASRRLSDREYRWSCAWIAAGKPTVKLVEELRERRDGQHLSCALNS